MRLKGLIRVEDGRAVMKREKRSMRGKKSGDLKVGHQESSLNLRLQSGNSGTCTRADHQMFPCQTDERKWHLLETL